MADLNTLQAEAARLRQRLDSLAEMSNEGLPVAEAQAQARERLAAVEARIATLGDVHGDVVTGTKTTDVDQRGQQVKTQVNVAHLYQVYQSAPGRARLSEDAFRRVLADYLDWVIREYGHTRLHGLQNLQQTGALSQPLSQVYTSLTVRHRPAVAPGGAAFSQRRGGHPELEEEMRTQPEPLDMAALLTLGERVAIIGGAGSGKTTYLSFVAASLAAALRGHDLDLRLKPPAPDAPLPVPLLAPLRFWRVYRDECAQVPGLRVTHGPDEGSLGAFLLWFLRSRYKNFDAAGDFFDRLLRGRGGCLILLDGMDEVVSVAERRTVRDGVDRLLRSQYPGNRCLVTAREAGYRDAPFGSDFVRCDIEPMTDEQIATLVGAWCDQVYVQANDRHRACQDLLGAIKALNAERAARGQPPLVATPLMVTMVVSVKYSRRELPRERAKLYDACVDVVLGSEYTGREDDAGARRRLVAFGGPPDRQREWLSYLAFHMHRGGQAGASLDEEGVRAVLKPALEERGDVDLLDPFLAATRHRGGLFEERGYRFQFMHLTFQEYLAAQYLAWQWEAQGADFLCEIVSDKWWREVLLLTVGSLGPPTPYERLRAFVTALCQLEGPVATQLASAELAATGLTDLVEPKPALETLARDRLVALVTDPALTNITPAARAGAGKALAQVGDPRFREDAWFLPNEPLLGFVEIPSGLFLMGEGHQQHEVMLPKYYIARYPVTAAQFSVFSESEASTTGHLQPETYPAEKNVSNHPIRYVTWYDALAYCQWLTDKLRSWERTPRILAKLLQEENWCITLPSEAEWEKAARGPEGSWYPWGDKPDPARANYWKTGVGTTSAVGCFPAGASHYEIEDLSGNVWEWTRSMWGTGQAKPDFEYPYDPNEEKRENIDANKKIRRAIRGGAFIDVARNIRCAYRDSSPPDYRDDYIGFRIVLSPPRCYL